MCLFFSPLLLLIFMLCILMNNKDLFNLSKSGDILWEMSPPPPPPPPDLFELVGRDFLGNVTVPFSAVVHRLRGQKRADLRVIVISLQHVS